MASDDGDDDGLDAEEAELARLTAIVEAKRAAKRERELREEHANSGLLVPASPSPTKKRKPTLGNLGDARLAKTLKRPSTSSLAARKGASIHDNDQQRLAPQRVTGASTLMADFNSGKSRLKEAADRRTVQRSSAFAEIAPKRQAASAPSVQAKNDKGKARAVEEDHTHEEAEEQTSVGNRRNEDLTLVNDLQPGPKPFKAPIGDPKWKEVEPNSGIRLRSRVLPHEELQEYLSDRYHIPPELLYSLVRKTKGGTEYEMPVEGDWIVIGVLAEKSEIRTTGQSNYTAAAAAEALKKRKKEKREKAKLKAAAKKNKENDAGIDNLIYNEAESDKELKSSDGENGDSSDDDEEQGNGYKPQARKYVPFKLIDLRLKGAGGGTGILNLKLFESDPEKSRRKATHHTADEGTIITKKGVRYEKENADDGTSSTSVRTEYKGGSGGAFEKFWKERNGTVIAILNPRIMKPWQSAYQNNENANIISITPESADSILVIGRARDLGSCTAMKRDGKLCGAWCDTRQNQNQVCDFHIQKAVKNTRAGRAEFFAGTNGMEATSVTSAFKNMQKHRQGNAGSAVASGSTSIPCQTSSIPSYKANSSRLTSYDPVNKTGLLPRDNVSNVDGSKTYVVGSSASIAPSSRFGGRNSKFIDGPPVAKEMDPKAKAEKKAREEKHLQRFLGRDGGKTLGAKYLVSNGKAKLEKSSRREGREGANGTESEDTDDAGPRGSKKRVFDVAAVRKIGWDPSSLNMDSASKLAKQRQLEASNLLGTAPRSAPKLGPAPGAKIRSGVSVPAGARFEQPTLPATTDDWDNLDDFDSFEHGAQRQAFVDDCDVAERMDMEDTGYLFSSDDEQEVPQARRVCVYDEPNEREDDDDDDLEIEPPANA